MIYVRWQDFVPVRERLRAEGRKLVFTNGCFDLLHPGHLKSLETARQLGDVLIVAINTDAGVGLNKPGRPIVGEQERAEVLDALEFVDAVTFFAEPTPAAIVAGLLPDVLVKGADWGAGQVVGQAEVEAAGGRVVRVALAPGYSTTAIIEAIRRGRPLQPPEAS